MFTQSITISAIIFLISASITGCGGGKTTTSNKFDGKEYVPVDAGDLSRSESSISGSGSFVFNTPLTESDSKDSYRITFTLQEGGSLNLVAHSTNTLTNGAGLKFTRSGSALVVSIETPGGSTNVSDKFKTGSGVDASKELTFQIDNHGEELAHIVAWDSSIASPDKTNARFNSEDDGQAKGRGAGTYWGILLSKAGITSAQLSSAKFIE